ncbi:hypothetical protein QUF70_22015 [Desulfobacterales bacterium HSG17]|nr:hypothetical protein [Desulfobacterales bacterium HSG17]
MKNQSLSWPFFEDYHRKFAHNFQQWASSKLEKYKYHDGGDEKVAREIFQLMGKPR